MAHAITPTYLSELCMRSHFWLATTLVMACFLVGCGGGGGNDSERTPVATTCDSGTLWAAHPAASGSAIPDNNATGVSVTWDNQNCTLQSISTATLDICLSHQRPSDLVWTITTPDASAPLTLTAPADWNTTGSLCDSGQGKLQRFNLLPQLTSNTTTRGIWRLQVSDGLAGTAGTLIQWRVLAQGPN